MSIISDYYNLLFGRDHLKDGNVIDFAEHGREGGVDTGQGFKFTQNLSDYVTGVDDGVTTVTTAGTDVPLASSTVVREVTIQAQTDNTGLIAIGASGVDATESTGTGVVLYAGDTITLKVNNLANIYIDSTVSGEGVRYTYLT